VALARNTLVSKHANFKDTLVLATGRCRLAGIGVCRLELLPVVLNEVKLLSMTIAGIEIVLLHLRICLVIVPVIVIETVYGAHDSGAMPSTRAVYVKLAGGWIISNLQKRAYLVRGWILFVNNGNVHVAHSGGLNGRLFALPGIVSQINDCFDTECREVSKVLGFWPSSAIKILVHLAKVTDFDVGETTLLALAKASAEKAKTSATVAIIVREDFLTNFILKLLK